MRVSVVVPVFNEAKFMHVALDSLRMQTVPFELIVVNNESTDESVSVAKMYTINVLSAKRGKLNALQLGILDATGDVVLTVDADVQLPSDYVARMTGPFEDPEVVLVVGSMRNLGSYGFQVGGSAFKQAVGYAVLKYGAGTSRALRREAFIKAGGFNLNVDQQDFISMVLEEEIGLHQRLASLGKTVYDPSIVACHIDRRGVCSNCTSDDSCQFCQYCQEIRMGQRF